MPVDRHHMPADVVFARAQFAVDRHVDLGVVVRIELQLAGFHHGVVRAGDFHAAEVRLDAFGEAEGQRLRRRADAGVGLRRFHFQVGVRQRLLRGQADEQNENGGKQATGGTNFTDHSGIP